MVLNLKILHRMKLHGSEALKHKIRCNKGYFRTFSVRQHQFSHMYSWISETDNTQGVATEQYKTRKRTIPLLNDVSSMTENAILISFAL